MTERVHSLALLSGKGGSGKTVLGLCISRALAEAGYKVLLVDCDLTTHGATYFFEDKLRRGGPSLTRLASAGTAVGTQMILVEENFWFLPSSSGPEDVRESSSSSEDLSTSSALKTLLDAHEYEIMVFDCQAGYSPLVRKVAEIADQSIVVLEPDAVSSSALRVLFLQLGSVLNRANTWQLFNKITEDERVVYEKLSGGTLFPNLPPIPFDWQVRAAFATSRIPSVTSQSSAFGLGVLRILKLVFPALAESITVLEHETVGKWHEDVIRQLERLNEEKSRIEYEVLESERRTKLQRIKIMSIGIAFVGLSASVLSAMDRLFAERLFPTGVLVGGMGIVIAALSYVWYAWSVRDIRRERDRDLDQRRVRDVELELERYSTLLATDPSLREYVRQMQNMPQSHDAGRSAR